MREIENMSTRTANDKLARTTAIDNFQSTMRTNHKLNKWFYRDYKSNNNTGQMQTVEFLGIWASRIDQIATIPSPAGAAVLMQPITNWSPPVLNPTNNTISFTNTTGNAAIVVMALAAGTVSTTETVSAQVLGPTGNPINTPVPPTTVTTFPWNSNNFNVPPGGSIQYSQATTFTNPIIVGSATGATLTFNQMINAANNPNNNTTQTQIRGVAPVKGNVSRSKFANAERRKVNSPSSTP